MTEFRQYRKKSVIEARPYHDGDSVVGVSISEIDYHNGSPKQGDMIARDPDNHKDQWLVSAEYFKNYEPISDLEPADMK